jgi:histone H3/H4
MSVRSASSSLEIRSAMTTAQNFRISRAAIRRLAHDAQQKFSRDSYDGAVDELRHFLGSVLRVSQHAAVFSRRKVVAREHVLYALDSLSVPVPGEVRALDAEGLSKLQRCNPKAPAQQRKRSVLHVELSEAAFARLAKCVARKDESLPSRLSFQARRILQLVAEQHLMRFFAEKGDVCSDALARDALTAEALQVACECPAEVATALTACLGRLLDRIPALLSISRTKTIDGKLLHAALASTCGACDAPPENNAMDSTDVKTQKLARLCDRILRGRAADKRITASASVFLARALIELSENEARRARGGQYAALSGAALSGAAPTPVDVT